MKLSQYCKKNGISYRTGYQWFRDGHIKNAHQTPTGTILIDEPLSDTKERVVVYARVSTYERSGCLDGQVKRCVDFANARGLEVHQVYKEIGSGMNDNRKKFWKMIDSHPTTIIVENKDRLTRFGFNYIERLLDGRCKVLVLNTNNDESDPIKDMISVVTSFCCRLYGMRRGINKSKKIEKIMKSDES